MAVWHPTAEVVMHARKSAKYFIYYTFWRKVASVVDRDRPEATQN